MWPPAVIVHGPIPNRHLKMAFVEWNQEVETFATKAAAESFAHRVRLRGPRSRTQNPYTQIGKTLVDIRREDAVAIVDDETIRVPLQRVQLKLKDFRCSRLAVDWTV